MNPQEVAVQEDEGLGWGKSLPVPSVQEMVRKDSQSLPERYIQEHNNRPLDSEFSPDLCEIPIINFYLLANGDEEEQRKLDLACKEWGFFQITDHGVTEKVLHDMKAAEAAFFELPLEEKKKYAMGENDLQGYGQGYVVSEQQKLEWCDLIFLMTLPPNIRKFKHWPVSIPGFKKAVETYSTEMQKVAEEMHKQKWVPVKPIPNAIVVNIGDALEVWSNGVYKSIEHRAVTNEKRSRMSIATFLIPGDEVEIGPLESMVDDKHHPRMYKKIKYLDFLRHSLGGKLDGKAHTEFLKLDAE
ncbi:hypothetical protein QYF36_022257 [Acer negundo]|nr:hypothetical protein QYF36_022257 [Acer negundo]